MKRYNELALLISGNRKRFIFLCDHDTKGNLKEILMFYVSNKIYIEKEVLFYTNHNDKCKVIVSRKERD